jgi:hypothetical protein
MKAKPESEPGGKQNKKGIPPEFGGESPFVIQGQ